MPTSIARARRAVVAFGQRFQADTDKLALATSEAVTNVVRHAYRGDRHGPVRLTAEFDGSDIVVEVSDGGIGMVPHPESDGLGLGLPLIGAMASEVKLDSSPPGLSVLMRFPCPEAG